MSLLCAAVWVVASTPAAVARTPPRVVVAQPLDRPVRPGLVPSLRIQLRGTAEVTVRQVSGGPDLPARVAAATSLAREAGADWVVWADPASSDEPGLVVLYVIGRREDRVLVEVVRVPAGDDAEVDRSLALKVHDLIGHDDGAAYALGNAAPPPAKAARSTAAGASLELGLRLGDYASAGLGADGFVGVGATFSRSRLLWSPSVELSMSLPRSAATSAGRIEWTEVSAGAALRLVARFATVSPFGELGGRLVLVDAKGRAATGEHGSASPSVFALLLHGGATLPLWRSLALGASAGIEQRVRAQRFALAGQEVANLGRTLPLLRVSLVARMP